MKKLIAILIALAGFVAACESPSTPEEVERVTQAQYYNAPAWDSIWCGVPPPGVGHYYPNQNASSNPGTETVFLFWEDSSTAGYGYCLALGKYGFNMGQAWGSDLVAARINLHNSGNGDQFSSLTIGGNIRVELHWDTNGLGSAVAFECGGSCPSHWSLASGTLQSWNDQTSSVSLCRLQDKVNGWCPTY